MEIFHHQSLGSYRDSFTLVQIGARVGGRGKRLAFMALCFGYVVGIIPCVIPVRSQVDRAVFFGDFRISDSGLVCRARRALADNK